MFIISAFFILLYIFVLFLLSAFFVKRALNSYEEYTLCGRSLTIWYIILTYLGTWIGGGTIIALAGGTYAHVTCPPKVAPVSKLVINWYTDFERMGKLWQGKTIRWSRSS